MVDLKFLCKGHSYMRPDGVFGRINTAAKTHDIEIPSEWFSVMMESGTKPTEMLPQEFLDMTIMLRGLFTICRFDEQNKRVDNITTYAWF